MSAQKLSRFLTVLGCLAAATAPAGTSEWVHPSPDGKLVYQATPEGDHVMDFSTAGYRGGGFPLPAIAVRKVVLNPGGGDSTALIQSAINEVGRMAVQDDGYRGTVFLSAGAFNCSNSIVIPVNGIVLRGSGSGANGTTIKMTGPSHPAIIIGNSGRRGQQPERPPDDDDPDVGPDAPPVFTSAHTIITDAYVPSGATSFTVSNANGFAVGDIISIHRPTTARWIKFMGMDDLVRNGHHQTWLGPGRDEIIERKIAAVSGNQITVTIPLSDSFDSRYVTPPAIEVAKVRVEPRIIHVGVEHLHIQCPPLEIAYTRAPYSAVRVNGDDCWVRDVYCEETMNSTVLAGKRITMEQVRVTHTFPNLGASKPTDFSIQGSQILIDRCEVTGDNEYFVWTTSLQSGPNVILNSTFRGRGSRIQPHMRWSTGLLVDNCAVPDGGIDFANRGIAGSGHGWTMGWAVAWNCVAHTYVVQNPPGAVNWAIGCIGDRIRAARYFDSEPVLPDGIFDSHGTPVTPPSLYLAQLQQRMDADALKNIGYASNSPQEFTNKNVARLPEFPMDANKILGTDLAINHPTNPSSVRNNARQFGGEKAVDGDANTYWQANDNSKPASLEIDMEGPVEINTLSLEEAAGMTGRVQSYKVEGQVNSEWKLLSQGGAIGERKVDKFPTMTVWKVKLTVLQASDVPAIRELGLYLDENEPGSKSAPAAAKSPAKPPTRETSPAPSEPSEPSAPPKVQSTEEFQPIPRYQPEPPKPVEESQPQPALQKPATAPQPAQPKPAAPPKPAPRKPADIDNQSDD